MVKRIQSSIIWWEKEKTNSGTAIYDTLSKQDKKTAKKTNETRKIPFQFMQIKKPAPSVQGRVQMLVHQTVPVNGAVMTGLFSVL